MLQQLKQSHIPYWHLQLSINGRRWVLISAIAAILVTVIVTRAGFLTGVRLAGDLFAELGKSLARAKLSWFTNEQRAQIKTIAGQGIPGFMSIPAHQLQTFYMLHLCLYF